MWQCVAASGGESEGGQTLGDICGGSEAGMDRDGTEVMWGKTE